MIVDWCTEPLGGHADIRARIGWRGLSASEYRQEGPFLIAGQHLLGGRVDWDQCDHLSEFRYQESPEIALKPGDVILSKDGTIGRVARIDTLPGPATLNGTMMLLRPKNSLDYRYLFHFLGGKGFHKLIEDKVSGSSIPHIFQRDMVSLPIVLPQLAEQRRIATILDTMDKAIGKTEAVIAKLRQVRVGLLHDLLTRGLDENGELREPIAHPEQFRESSLGRLPLKWQILRLENASNRVQDGTHFSPKSNTGPRRYVTSKNIRFGFLDLTECGWISEDEHKEIYRRCGVQKFDILLTKDGANTGNAALNTLDEEFSLLSSVALIRCRHGLSHHDFLLNYFLSPLGQKRLKDMKSGNAITRLTLQKIKDFAIPLPPFDEQTNIADKLRPVADTITSFENEFLKLTKVKHGLMSDLLTGRVRVPEDLELPE